MYEDVTYEGILKRMLDRIPDTMDKREGSVIYDALAPAALEIKRTYVELDQLMDDCFADTASRGYLIRRAAERGLYPKAATFSTLRAVCVPASADVPVGARFTLNDLSYAVSERLSDDEYVVVCEQIGSVGNKYFGGMTAVDYIRGLESFSITELMVPGEDEEDTEIFRKRYLASFDSHAYGGNAEDYIQKTTLIAGVGAVKVTPVWNGGGTVLLTILDSGFNAAGDALIEQVQQQIDPLGDGSGTGIAPIGHIVTVDTARNVQIDVKFDLVLEDGYTFERVKERISAAVESYLLEIRGEWQSHDSSAVRIAQIETRIIGVEGVVDIQNTKINGIEGNLILTKYQIPVLGVISDGQEDRS